MVNIRCIIVLLTGQLTDDLNFLIGLINHVILIFAVSFFIFLYNVEVNSNLMSRSICMWNECFSQQDFDEIF